ncbi:MAG: protein translocase subunit SecD [Parvibaculum sp.]|uniref:protein translocase subunit SecD n=1 Tax=Parvibaculum sp. TaxID=2024848 RepID=UPI003C75221F
MLQFERWKITLILLVTLAGFLYTAPNFLPKSTLEGLPAIVPHKQINLGLDLRGGSYLLLEVDTATVNRDRLQQLINDVRRALRSAEVLYTGLGISGDNVTVRITRPEDMAKAAKAVRDLSSVVTSNLLSGGLPERDLSVSTSGNLITVSVTDSAKMARAQSAVQQSMEIVRRRIDELGTTEPVIQQQGSDRILVQVPGLDDPQRLKALLGQTAKLNFRLVDVSTTAQQALATHNVPAGSEVLYMTENPSMPLLVQRRVMVGGDSLIDAQPGFDQRTNEPIVSFRFDSTGARLFGEVTRENVGKPFAIVLDNKVISAPVIREPILGGSGQISGNFTVQQANDLAILLRAGALPAPLNVLEERTVGPGLGADSVRAGAIASIIGSVAVIIYMVASYGLFGVFANIALIVNIALIMGALSLLQATLTLPGIAGIVLTIGTAVDANVLVYERIREELRTGKSVIASIEAGYHRALATILDANITHFIAAAVLFELGSGPVRGFAVTLAIGVVTSVFTGFTVNRLIVSTWVRRRRPKTLVL